MRILPAKAWKNLCGSLTAALLRKGSACCRCVIPKRTFSFICSARRSFPAICKTAKLPSQLGYPCESCGKCLAALTRKLRSGEGFPHEIGLFLSYPPEDVKGFIENHAANYKLSGLWKVYGDEKKAKELFAKYKKCTDIYCERYEAGCGIAELAVAV